MNGYTRAILYCGTGLLMFAQSCCAQSCCYGRFQKSEPLHQTPSRLEASLEYPATIPTIPLLRNLRFRSLSDKEMEDIRGITNPGNYPTKRKIVPATFK